MIYYELCYKLNNISGLDVSENFWDRRAPPCFIMPKTTALLRSKVTYDEAMTITEATRTSIHGVTSRGLAEHSSQLAAWFGDDVTLWMNTYNQGKATLISLDFFTVMVKLRG